MHADLQAIVFAAGKSKRFNTGNTKLVEKICGQELILYPTTTLEQLHIPTTLVVGYQKDTIIEVIKKTHDKRIHFITQENQLGTGHALLCTKENWFKKNILVLNGDIPLLTNEIITSLYKKHIDTNAAISFVSAHNNDPSSHTYGRIIKTDGDIKIIEARELSNEQLQEYCCINAGIYVISKDFLETNIAEINRNQLSNEFHITDLVKIASEKKYTISMISAPFDRVRGINTFQELWAAEQIKRAELIKYWMNKGVHFSVAQNVHIDLNVHISSGTFVGCGVHLLQGTRIGKNCKIQAFSLLENTIIGDNTIIDSHCIVKDSLIGENSHVGPFAHLRDNTTLAAHTTIGNFVEVKQSTIGEHTKAKHLTYLGNAHIGSRVNIGAGTITCNHNGSTKEKTTIKDDAYIGSNNSLVAPVIIEKNAFTAAGSVITENVPADALAIARTRQTNKDGYAKKLKEKTSQSDNNKKTKSDSLSFIGAIKTNNDRRTIE